MTIIDVYPLSPLQSGILYHSLREESASVYLLQFSYSLNGHLSADLVEDAFNELFRRHDILRTAFNYDDLKKPVQLVLGERTVEFHREDLSGLTAAEQQQAIRQFRNRDQVRGFDLRKDTLMRVALLRLGEQQYEMIWSFHHILMDGWCMSILIHELMEIYNGRLRNKQHTLPAVTPYRHYIQWLEQQENERALGYWKNYLAGLEEATPLEKQIRQNGFLQLEEILLLDEQTTQLLEKQAAKLQVTLNALIQTAWALLLARYNDTNDVVFGTIVSGRPADIQGIETMIGLFINAIPVRVAFEETDTLAAVSQKVHQDGVNGINYHFCQLADIQSLTPVGNKLIDHLLVFENYPIEEQIEGIVLQQQQEETESFQVGGIDIFEHSNYDLNLVIVPGRELCFKFRYNSYSYPQQWISRLAGHLSVILNSIAANPEGLTADINMLTATEQEALIIKGTGNTDTEWENETAVTLFEKVVALHPAQPAVRWDNGQLSYEQLNEKANITAHTLQQKYGVTKGQHIAVVLERSEWAIISILAILKAGAVYLPIDPVYPAERIKDILEQAAVGLLITDSSTLFSVMEYYNQPLLAIDIELEGWEKNGKNPERVAAPADLSYMIYTSGSTGKPNGVMITHEGQVNMFRSQVERFAPDTTDHILQFASLSFDASVWEISMALLSGATLELITKDRINDTTAFIDYLNKQQVTIATLPPVYVKDVAIGDATAMRILVTAGEEAHPEEVEKYGNKCRYFNAYGPSEYSVCITAYEWKKGDLLQSNVPIGTPFLNTQVLLLDQELRILPDGLPGEICVSGKGIALGYLNNQELTAKRFVPHPFIAGEKLYRTGDRGRWTEEGNLEFLGRKDAQVKIRGHRVEIGEVTAAIKKIQDISDVVIIPAKEQGTVFLKAYYVAPQALSDTTLREELATALPEYMVPAFFIWMEKLPLNNNGKVDKKQLPEPGLTVSLAADITDRDEVELAAIWSEVLGVPVTSSQHHFFHLGGHSLKVIQLISRVMKQFSVRIDLKDVFDQPQLKQQIELIRKVKDGGFENITPLPEQQYYPISHAQKRLWILQQLEEDKTTYNIPHAYRILGPVNRLALEKAFNYVVKRHEVLRTTIQVIGSEPQQQIHDAAHFAPVAHFQDISGEENRQELAAQIAAAEGKRVFDLENGPLFYCKILQLDKQEFVLLLNFHHIIMDGWSMTIFIRELLDAYNAYRNGMETSHTPLRIHYKEYASWHNKQLDGYRLKEHRKFWTDLFKDGVPRVQLPLDHPRPAKKSYQGKWSSFRLEQDAANALQEWMKEKDVTLFMGVRAMVQLLLFFYTGQTDVVTGSPVAGRSHVDLEHMLGFMVNILPIRAKGDAQDTFDQLLEEVKKNVLLSFRHQMYPFDQIVEDIHAPIPAGCSPVFDIMVILQNHNDINITDNAATEEHGLALSEIDAGYAVSKYDISFIFTTDENGITVSFEYAADIFNESRIGLMQEYLKKIMLTLPGNGHETLTALKAAIMGKAMKEKTRRDLSFDFS